MRHGEVRHQILHGHHQLRMSRRENLQGAQTMMTKQTDAVALTEQQLDAVAGGVMPDENGRPCADPFRRPGSPIGYPGAPSPFKEIFSDPRERRSVGW